MATLLTRLEKRGLVSASRDGRQVANTTSARAIQPLPEVSPSCHILNCATA